MTNPPVQFQFPPQHQMVPHGNVGPSLSLDAAVQQSDPLLNVPQLILSPLFIDNLAKDFELNVIQRQHLHTCAQVSIIAMSDCSLY